MDTIILLPEIFQLPQHVFAANKGMKPLLQIKSNNLNVKINWKKKHDGFIEGRINILRI